MTDDSSDMSVVSGEQIEEGPGKGGMTDLTEVTGDQSRKAMDEVLDRDAKDMIEEEHTKESVLFHWGGTLVSP